MRNDIYLIVPVLKQDECGSTSIIRTMQSISQDEYIAIVKNAIHLCKLVVGECDDKNSNVAVYYVKKVLDELYNKAKQVPPKDKKYLMGVLRKFFDNFISLKPAEDKEFEATHPDLEPYADMIKAYLDNKESSAIANADAIVDRNVLFDYKGDMVSVDFFDDPLELYKWLIAHRNPQRQYDPNYQKHGKKEKFVKHGMVASANTYKQEELEQFLKLAVRASKTHDELYFHDLEKGKYIIFFDENMNSLYHAFEFAESDNVDTQIIWKRGGRDLDDRIKMVVNM